VGDQDIGIPGRPVSSGLQNVSFLVGLRTYQHTCKADDFRKKNFQISNLMKIRSVGAPLLEGQTEGQKDISKLITAFRDFVTKFENEKPIIYDLVK
jgi:hypothetical protein